MRDQTSKVTFDRNEYETPGYFFKHIHSKYNFAWDLACTGENAKLDWGVTSNSLEKSWSRLKDLDGFNLNKSAKGRWLWLNPPYGDLKTWFMKCQREANAGAKIVVLAPPVMGTKYFKLWIPPKITFITGRIQFEYKGEVIKGNKYESVLYFFRPRRWFEKSGKPEVDWLDLEDIPR